MIRDNFFKMPFLAIVDKKCLHPSSLMLCSGSHVDLFVILDHFPFKLFTRNRENKNKLKVVQQVIFCSYTTSVVLPDKWRTNLTHLIHSLKSNSFVQRKLPRNNENPQKLFRILRTLITARNTLSYQKLWNNKKSTFCTSCSIKYADLLALIGHSI